MCKQEENNTSLNLSESRKEIIQVEEKYRLEVIKALNKKKLGLWELLNSSFVIFLLTIIVLSLIPFLYQNRQIHKESVKQQKLIIAAINIRIDLILPIIDKSIKNLILTDQDRYDISNSFSGEMKHSIDSIKTGIPGLLLQLNVYQNKSTNIELYHEFIKMQPIMQENELYSPGGGYGDVKLTNESRKILNNFRNILLKIKELKPDS